MTKRYLVDYSLSWAGPPPNNDWRREVSQSNPVELGDGSDHEDAGRAVAEAARARFRADYGDAGDLNIEVTRIAEIVPPKED